MRAKNIQLLLQ